jgi:hypothetical protein
MASTVLSILKASNSVGFAEVADRVISTIGASEVDTPCEQRTLRRRVYDVLNVFCAMGLIAKDNKFIRYRPLVASGKQTDSGTQIQSRLLVKESRLTAKTRLFLGYQLLLAGHRERPRLPNAIQLPSIFVAFGDVGNGHVQRAFDGRRLEIIAHSPPRFFSPMDLFERMAFPAEEQIGCLRRMPALAGIEKIVFAESAGNEKVKDRDAPAQWPSALSM